MAQQNGGKASARRLAEKLDKKKTQLQENAESVGLQLAKISGCHKGKSRLQSFFEEMPAEERRELIKGVGAWEIKEAAEELARLCKVEAPVALELVRGFFEGGEEAATSRIPLKPSPAKIAPLLQFYAAVVIYGPGKSNQRTHYIPAAVVEGSDRSFTVSMPEFVLFRCSAGDGVRGPFVAFTREADAPASPLGQALAAAAPRTRVAIRLILCPFAPACDAWGDYSDMPEAGRVVFGWEFEADEVWAVRDRLEGRPRGAKVAGVPEVQVMDIREGAFDCRGFVEPRRAAAAAAAATDEGLKDISIRCEVGRDPRDRAFFVVDGLEVRLMWDVVMHYWALPAWRGEPAPACQAPRGEGRPCGLCALVAEAHAGMAAAEGSPEAPGPTLVLDASGERAVVSEAAAGRVTVPALPDENAVPNPQPDVLSFIRQRHAEHLTGPPAPAEPAPPAADGEGEGEGAAPAPSYEELETRFLELAVHARKSRRIARDLEAQLRGMERGGEEAVHEPIAALDAAHVFGFALDGPFAYWAGGWSPARVPPHAPLFSSDFHLEDALLQLASRICALDDVPLALGPHATPLLGQRRKRTHTALELYREAISAVVAAWQAVDEGEAPAAPAPTAAVQSSDRFPAPFVHRVLREYVVERRGTRRDASALVQILAVCEGAGRGSVRGYVERCGRWVEAVLHVREAELELQAVRLQMIELVHLGGEQSRFWNAVGSVLECLWYQRFLRAVRARWAASQDAACRSMIAATAGPEPAPEEAPASPARARPAQPRASSASEAAGRRAEAALAAERAAHGETRAALARAQAQAEGAEKERAALQRRLAEAEGRERAAGEAARAARQELASVHRRLAEERKKAEEAEARAAKEARRAADAEAALARRRKADAPAATGARGDDWRARLLLGGDAAALLEGRPADELHALLVSLRALSAAASGALGEPRPAGEGHGASSPESPSASESGGEGSPGGARSPARPAAPPGPEGPAPPREAPAPPPPPALLHGPPFLFAGPPPGVPPPLAFFGPDGAGPPPGTLVAPDGTLLFPAPGPFLPPHALHAPPFPLAPPPPPPGPPLRPLRLPGGALEAFERLAGPATEAYRKTAAYLAVGEEPRTGGLALRALVLPRQAASAQGCAVRPEDREAARRAAAARGLSLAGVVTATPGQACALSSVDMHELLEWQRELPEAVFVVLAPKSPARLGVFRLTERGLLVVAECRHTGYHEHPLPKHELHHAAPHVRLGDAGPDEGGEAPFEIVDLRP